MYIKIAKSSPKWFTPNCISKPSAVFEYGHIMIPALLIRMSILDSSCIRYNNRYAKLLMYAVF